MDMRDGKMLLKLLEVLSGDRLVLIFFLNFLAGLRGSNFFNIKYSFEKTDKHIKKKFLAASNSRKNAHSLFGKCGQRSTIFT